jgi:Arc/MetJ-type ribon-helix-helix transcriptional regulator
MRRTTISLPEELADALGREARRSHVSASEVARTALTKHLGLTAGETRKLPFAELGRSGSRTTARDMEQLLEHEWDDVTGRS